MEKQQFNNDTPRKIGDQQVIDLIMKLISFDTSKPNEKDPQIRETEAMQYIEDYIKNIFGSDLQYERQNIGDGDRYNLIVKNTESPDIILGGHVDVVESDVKTKETYQVYTPKIEGNKLFGRGAVDMKSGVAMNISLIDDLMRGDKKFRCLFYCDEEYKFLGMKKFVEQYKGKIQPKISIIPESTNNEIIVGFRGITEFDLKIKGMTCHAARKLNGINAINSFVEFGDILENMFRNQDDLGFDSSVNIGGIEGGFEYKDKDTGEYKIKGAGNKVAEICKGRFEVRIGNYNVSQQDFESFMQSYFQKKGIEILEYKNNFRLKPLIQNELLEKYKEFGKTVSSPNFGYSDIGMIKNELGGDCIQIGPSPNTACHQENEYVEIDSIFKARDQIISILTSKKYE